MARPRMTAQRLLAAVAARLGCRAEYVFAAYEDAFYYLWRERRLPANVDPSDSRLEDAQEGARLARVFDTRAGQRRRPCAADRPRCAGTHWLTGAWFLRDERCYLMPGDSPLGIGCRWIRCPGRHPTTVRICMRRIRLRRLRRCRATRRFASGLAAVHARVAESPSATARHAATSRPTGSRAPRCAPSRVTACCMCSCRRPVTWRISRAGRGGGSHGCGVVAAGHARGLRAAARSALLNFRVTPDPGVIEVNIHPGGELGRARRAHHSSV